MGHSSMLGEGGVGRGRGGVNLRQAEADNKEAVDLLYSVIAVPWSTQPLCPFCGPRF